MKRALLILGFICAGAAAAASAPAPFKPTLVSRLVDASEGSRAPIKRMWYAPDAAVADADWPFDVARVERLLEKTLQQGEDGTFRLKRDAASLDAQAAAQRALEYVNRFIAEWSVLQLDAKFPRCSAQTIKSLGAFREEIDPSFWMNYAIFTKGGAMGGGSMKAGGWITAWQITSALYLVLTNELGTKGCPREYQFVMWDGKKDWPIVGFNSFPDAARVALVKRILTVPAAVNNLAVLLHSREANRTQYRREYVESLLRRAAGLGCDAAFHNLGVLMEEAGRKDDAAAFYSREGTVSKKEEKP